MVLSSIQKKTNAVGLVCSGFLLAAIAWPCTAIAQFPKVAVPNSSDELQAQSGTNDLGVSESDRVSRLQTLQRSIIERAAEASAEGSAVVPPNSSGVTGATPPLPEDLGQAIAIATPVNNQLSVSLINNTGTALTYEVLGDTDMRELMMDESAMLQGIVLPTTITFVRPDNGLVTVTAVSSQEGMLEIVLMPKSTLDDVQGVVRIQEGGQVFLN